MKKRLWLLIGILTAGIGQLLLNSIWYRTFPVMDILLLYKTVSAFSYAAVIGLLYLHVPEPGRRLRAGLILGCITGLLIGSYQYFDSLAFSASSLPMNIFEIVRILLLGAVCGTAVAVSELQWNPNRKKRNGPAS